VFLEVVGDNSIFLALGLLLFLESNVTLEDASPLLHLQVVAPRLGKQAFVSIHHVFVETLNSQILVLTPEKHEFLG